MTLLTAHGGTYFLILCGDCVSLNSLTSFKAVLLHVNKVYTLLISACVLCVGWDGRTAWCWCQMVLVNESYTTAWQHVAVHRRGILTRSLSRCTHVYAAVLSRCSLAKPTSLNPARTSPSVTGLRGLGCSLPSHWMRISGKCPTIGCCQLVKFFCYHGCRVSCPNVSECILWCW